MKVYSVYHKKFNKFGKVLKGDYSSMLALLEKTPCPDDGVIYKASEQILEENTWKDIWEREVFGGMPIQVGYCNGVNNTLNALEYHKGNEINLGVSDIILILGDMRDIKDGKFNTKKAQAFLLPAGVAVEMYSTTLHYAPCGVKQTPFRVVIVLPKGTNLDKPENAQDKTIWGSNKWLIAHQDSPEAKQCAFVGLVGKNLTVE